MPKLDDSLFAARLFVLALMLGLSGPLMADAYENSLSSARLGDTRQLTNLLERGVDPDTVDAQGNTLLILAAREGHERTVEALLEHRADVSRRNRAGDSALMMAALQGHESIAERLIEAGAPVDHMVGWAPLLYAAFSGHERIFDRLLEAGADVNATAPNGANALMLAARNGNIDIVRTLLKTDINLYQETDRGHSAIDWALESRNTIIADKIREAQEARPRPPE